MEKKYFKCYKRGLRVDNKKSDDMNGERLKKVFKMEP